MNATVEQIRAIIESEDVVKDMSKLSNDESLAKQGIDSLDLSNIYLLIEEEFDVTIPDEDLEQVGSVNQIISYLETK